MAYDEARQRVVMYGGHTGVSIDTWEYMPPSGSLTGDVNQSGATNGNDIQPFVSAVMSGSTNPTVLCSADFSGNSVMDATDVPGFVATLIGP
ncbi:MAG: hypothetical protein U1A27_06525 [Phycisphaerae bacterium]